MEHESPHGEPQPLDRDPEIAALLDFEPVVRKCVRHDGWLPERQREFIRALAVLGQAEQAAIAVGGTMSGVYKLRTAAGGEGFAAAWDRALALHLRRYPRPEPKGRPSRGEILSGAGRTPWPARGTAPSSPRFESPEAEMRERVALFEKIMEKYWIKVGAERTARLEGRIVAADYYVRQLTAIEIILEAGGHAASLLMDLKLGGRSPLNIVATPMSLLLDRYRRIIWARDDEPDRPPFPPLGDHDDQTATGPTETYSSHRDGDYGQWVRRQEDQRTADREAQQLWEEKARGEAEAWRERSESAESKANDA
jgi:hypothetical protein